MAKVEMRISTDMALAKIASRGDLVKKELFIYNGRGYG